VDYEPAESTTGLFRRQFQLARADLVSHQFLLIEALQKFHYFTGDSFKVEFPTGSGTMMNLWDVSGELSRRLSRIFLRDESGRRAVYGGIEKFQTIHTGRDLILFHEYFHGDNGAGWARATRQAGPDWFVSCCSRVESNLRMEWTRAEPATTLKIAETRTEEAAAVLSSEDSVRISA